MLLLAGGYPLTWFFRELRRGEARRASYVDEGPFIEDSGYSARWNVSADRYTTVEWSRTLGSIVTAVARAGLHITHLMEISKALSDDANVDGCPDAFVLRAVKPYTDADQDRAAIDASFLGTADDEEYRAEAGLIEREFR